MTLMADSLTSGISNETGKKKKQKDYANNIYMKQENLEQTII